jgi:YggT family protein
MSQALAFIVRSLGSLLVAVFLLRLLLQWSRANFRNPITQGILQLTSWLVMPLRRVLPPVGKLDTASLLAVLLVELAAIVLQSLARGMGMPPAAILTGAMALGVIVGALDLLCIVVIVYALLSLVGAGRDNPLQAPLASLAEPLLRPVRRILPALGGFDFSPVVAIIALQALRILLVSQWPLLTTFMV